VFFLAMAMHVALDLSLHNADAHRHFLPLSHWQFESPVSYWDPAHYGVFGAGLEVVCIRAASVVLWSRFEAR
jgi:hypothetical protein